MNTTTPPKSHIPTYLWTMLVALCIIAINIYYIAPNAHATWVGIHVTQYPQSPLYIDQSYAWYEPWIYGSIHWIALFTNNPNIAIKLGLLCAYLLPFMLSAFIHYRIPSTISTPSLTRWYTSVATIVCLCPGIYDTPLMLASMWLSPWIWARYLPRNARNATSISTGLLLLMLYIGTMNYAPHHWFVKTQDIQQAIMASILILCITYPYKILQPYRIWPKWVMLYAIIPWIIHDSWPGAAGPLLLYFAMKFPINTQYIRKNILLYLLPCIFLYIITLKISPVTTPWNNQEHPIQQIVDLLPSNYRIAIIAPPGDWSYQTRIYHKYTWVGVYPSPWINPNNKNIDINDARLLAYLHDIREACPDSIIFHDHNAITDTFNKNIDTRNFTLWLGKHYTIDPHIPPNTIETSALFYLSEPCNDSTDLDAPMPQTEPKNYFH